MKNKIKNFVFCVFFSVTFCICFQKNSKTNMEATAMNNFLQQLHDLVPAFDVASIPTRRYWRLCFPSTYHCRIA